MVQRCSLYSQPKIHSIGSNVASLLYIVSVDNSVGVHMGFEQRGERSSKQQTDAQIRELCHVLVDYKNSHAKSRELLPQVMFVKKSNQA